MTDGDMSCLLLGRRWYGPQYVARPAHAGQFRIFVPKTVLYINLIHVVD